MIPLFLVNEPKIRVKLRETVVTFRKIEYSNSNYLKEVSNLDIMISLHFFR
ncbi:hypothetical protein B4102_0497 [Heyndrickxia sporothermodurans]|uniref:Uncharacterized protein n=1 Tax=Heyndrickxia sporothermodurans TaxID=46224 RepID=A0A150L6B4_9BACI|nr:hypothetical protein B4102_0497 [Heyndrickxia sporothermodurans]